MKRFSLFVVFVVLIASGLFFQQILDALSGMSVLEMLQRSVSFVLHVIVVSILGYGLYMANEMILPWVKTFQKKQRHHRRQIRGRRTAAKASAGATRSQKDKGLLWIISQLARDYQSQAKRNIGSNRRSE
jgi:uncharacterized membrane protein